MNYILIHPHITEKTLSLAGKGVFTFQVATFANKYHIAREVAKVYAVHPMDVRIVNMHGRQHRVGKRRMMKTEPNWKKAMVRLQAGETISAFQITSKEVEKK